MRKLSRTMIGLLLGATVVAPIAAQAQEQQRERGGGWQRGGGDGGGDSGVPRGGWQRGGVEAGDSGAPRGGGQRGGDTGQTDVGNGRWRSGSDRGAMVDGDTRREAIQQAREAQRQVERPAPVAQPQTSSGEVRPRWRGNAGQPYDDSRPQEIQGRVDRGPDMVQTNRDRRRWNGSESDGRDERRDRDGDRRTRDRDRDDNRNWAGDRRDWNRDGYRDWNSDGNRSWSTDRRDWGRNDRRSWNRDWRSDRRYSWQDYRSRHRNAYRQPRYEARHGYSYRRWYPGYRWDSWYYSSSFWINNPWSYRLPPVDGPYRWVRYYDDVVLVDIETGEIIDIIYGFFW